MWLWFSWDTKNGDTKNCLGVVIHTSQVFENSLVVRMMAPVEEWRANLIFLPAGHTKSKYFLLIVIMYLLKYIFWIFLNTYDRLNGFHNFGSVHFTIFIYTLNTYHQYLAKYFLLNNRRHKEVQHTFQKMVTRCVCAKYSISSFFSNI